MSWGDDEEREILIACGVKDIRRSCIISHLSIILKFHLLFIQIS